MKGKAENAGRLLIRADAGSRMGTGHVMRCLALAQAWQAAGGTVLFVEAQAVPALDERLRGEGMEIAHLPPVVLGSGEDAAATAVLAQQFNAQWIVIDGYHFGAAYQKQLKEAGFRLLFVDDNGHADHYYADLVLNQNIHAEAALYQRREPYTRLLLGTSYALLRREFWPWRGWRREIPERARRILVTLGGSDPDNVTLKVIRALQQLADEGLETVVVVGGSNAHYDSLVTAVAEGSTTIQLRRNVTNMPALMAWADLAVSAGGSTCWELAFMGLPHLVLVLADNQYVLAEQLSAVGSAQNLGWHHSVSVDNLAGSLDLLLSQPVLRRQMSYAASQLVDGHGPNRIQDVMMINEAMQVRRASADDVRLLYEWVNDPVTRQMSLHSDQISWEDHQRWYYEKLSRQETLFFIVEIDDGKKRVPVGQVRVEKDGVVSISVAPEWRGQGVGKCVLRAALGELDRGGFPIDLIAYIKPENVPSCKIFSKAGFTLAGKDLQAGQICLRYVRKAGE